MRIVDLLERDAAVYGDRPAVEVVGGSRLTCGSSTSAWLRIAAALADRGVARGDRVAVMAGKGLLLKLPMTRFPRSR